MWTDKKINSFKPRDHRYRRSENIEVRGVGRLAIDVLPNGTKTFYFQYFKKVKGKSKRTYVSIGPYKTSATSSGYSLSEARDKAREYEQILKQGLDVKAFIEEKELEEQARLRRIEAEKRQGSFEQLMDSYMAAMKADGKRSHESVRRSLKIYVNTPFQDMIQRHANEIEADDIRLILSKMIDNGVTTHSNRVRAYLHAAFSHGLKQDNNPRRYSKEEVKYNLKYNPVTFVPKQSDYERVGEHVISEDEIKIIWENIGGESLLASWAVKLAFTTGQRLGELIRLKWENIDFKDRLMLIPASVSKNKLDHVVPLNDLSWEVIEEMKEITGNYDYLFPAKTIDKFVKDKHLVSTTISKVIREYCSGNKDVKKFLTRDIRRTVKTMMGKAGVTKEVRDKIQNHALMDVSSKHYDRYDYLNEKQDGLCVWNNYLDLIIHPRKNVIQLKK